MKRSAATLCFVLLIAAVVHVTAQINPYKEGTPGVTGYRSEVLSEVIVHVSAANYNLYKLVGTPPPTGVDVKGLEKSTTDKAKVIATLKDSFAHAKKAITAMPDADLEKKMDWFGGTNTERGILLFIVRHGAEHLGQSIAYARFAGVVPPWTADAQKAQSKTKEAPPKD